jgi:hypothetical protein
MKGDERRWSLELEKILTGIRRIEAIKLWWTKRTEVKIDHMAERVALSNKAKMFGL